MTACFEVGILESATLVANMLTSAAHNKGIPLRKALDVPASRALRGFDSTAPLAWKTPAGNELDASACQCVGAAVRNRQNQLRPSSPLWPVTTRRAIDNAPSAKLFT